MGVVLRKKKDFVPLDTPIYTISSRRFSQKREGWDGIVVYKDRESRDMIDMLLARVKSSKTLFTRKITKTIHKTQHRSPRSVLLIHI